MSDMSISDLFAMRMREERERAGVTQAELASRLSDLLGARVAVPIISRMESMDRTVRIEEAVAIAEALGVSLDRLLSPSDGDLQDRIERGRVLVAQAEVAYDRSVTEMDRRRKELDELRSALQVLIDRSDAGSASE